MEKRKRIVTKIGDLFSVDLDDKTKRFFQYVAIDESMLGGSVIRVFKRKYDIDAEPSFDEIVNDEVDFYTHTSLKIGILEGYWKKTGRYADIGDTENIYFRSVGELDASKLKKSRHWLVWKVNCVRQDIGEMKEIYKNYDLGSLFPSIWVLNKIKTGRMGIKLEEIE